MHMYVYAPLTLFVVVPIVPCKSVVVQVSWQPTLPFVQSMCVVYNKIHNKNTTIGDSTSENTTW